MSRSGVLRVDGRGELGRVVIPDQLGIAQNLVDDFLARLTPDGRGKGHLGLLSEDIKGRAVLHSIFAYGIRQEWCDVNPVARVEVPKVKEKTKEPLTPEEVEKLLRTAELPEHRAMRFSLHLMLYSGIRPTEVSRLQEDDFCWEERVAIIRPKVSKTGGGRMVPLRKLSHISEEERRIPRNWQQRWHSLRRAAGFRHWVLDICRHSFASYHAAFFRNLPELQLEMGHRDLSLLRSHYLSPALKKAAKSYFA